MRTVIESNATPAYDKAQALRLYVEQSEMDALVGEDMDRYRGALEATGGARLMTLNLFNGFMRRFRDRWTLRMPLRWLD